MKDILKLIVKYKLSLFAVLLLLYLSFNNARDYDDMSFLIFKHADKVIHFLMYFGVGSAIYTDYCWLLRKKATIISVISVAVLAIVTELGQTYLTETRSGDIFDFLCNIAGGITAMAVAPWIAKTYFKFVDYVRGIFKQ